MKMLKNNWAQIVCVVVLIAALGWAGMTAFQSGVDNTAQEKQYRDAKSSVEQQVTNPQSVDIYKVQPKMLAAIPQETPPTEISTAPRSFFPSGTPNVSTPVIAPKVAPVAGAAVDTAIPTEDIKLPAYLKPGMLEVYQLNTGNYLIAIMPWDRSMMAVTGFVIQRQEMNRTIQGEWKPKSGWVNLPKYLVQDEAKTAQPAAPEGAPAAPAAVPEPAAPARGLLGGGPAPRPAAAGGGLLGGGAPATANAFDLKKYQGIYVLFDKVEQTADTRFDYRLALIGKQFAEAVSRTSVSATGAPIKIEVYTPEGLSAAYAPNGVPLRVFAPGAVVQPTYTGKIQVKFVSCNEDKSVGSFIVMRGQATSKIVNIPTGEEIAAELAVLDEKGRPVVGEAGNLKETIQTGLIFATVEADAETKKLTAVLTDAKKAELLIEQGKTNGDPAAPEIDLGLLHKIQSAREKEYKTLFGVTPDKGDAAVPVPEKEFTAAAGEELANLKPNDFYKTADDETTPSSPLPQLTLAPKPKEVVRPIPVIRPVKPVAPAAVARPVHPGVVPPPPGPPGPPAGGFGDRGERPMMQEPGRDGGTPPSADAVYE